MRLLIIEDDHDLAETLKQVLQAENFAVDVAFEGTEGYFMATSEPYDALIIDIGLPKMDGLSVLKKVRQEGSTVPILLLTARDSEDDKVEGLYAGADDYLTKPFSLKECVARVQALLRRNRKDSNVLLTVADLVVDPIHHTVTRAEKVIDLSPKEFALLEYLLSHKDEVVSRTNLIEHVWDYNYDGISNVVDVFISYLRKKIDHGHDQKLIQTVHSVGFKISTEQ